MRSPERRATSNIFGLFASTGALPGSAIPSASHDDVHRVRGAHAGAHAGPRIALSLMPRSVSVESLPNCACTDAEEDVLDVDVLAVVLAARLIAADDEDRRDVEAARRHQMRGRRLVAGRQADHAVELRAFDGDLHVVHDEVAAGEDVAAAAPALMMKSLGAAVRISNGRPPAARTASLTTFATPSRWLKQIASSDELLTTAIFGFSHVRVGEPERLPLRAPHRLARGPGLEIAAQRSRHRHPSGDVRPPYIAREPIAASSALVGGGSRPTAHEGRE